MGSSRRATSVQIITAIDPVGAFLCWWTNFLLITLSANVHTSKWKPLTHICGLGRTSRTLFLLLAISDDLRYLLSVAAQSPAISYWFGHGCWGRVAGVISVRCLRVLKDHVPLFNDTLSHSILRAIWPQICMTECLLLLFIDCATHSCELCCERCMSREATFLIDRQTILQYSSLAHIKVLPRFLNETIPSRVIFCETRESFKVFNLSPVWHRFPGVSR